MKSKEDLVWESLLARSASTFAVAEAPPYGLATRVLAAVREEQQAAAVGIRIGGRAILASLLAVLAIGAVTFERATHEDVDPAVNSMAVVEDAQVS